MAGHPESAVAALRESLKRETEYFAPYVNLASTLGELGRLDEAKEVAREILRREPSFSIKAYMAGLSYRNPGDSERMAEGLRLTGLPE